MAKAQRREWETFAFLVLVEGPAVMQRKAVGSPCDIERAVFNPLLPSLPLQWEVCAQC